MKHTPSELWLFFKYAWVGTGSTLVELLAYLLLQHVVFAPLNSVAVEHWLLSFLGIGYWGYFYAYLLSISLGYALAFVGNRKFTFHSHTAMLPATVLYGLMVAFTIVVCTWLGSFGSTLLVNSGRMTPLADFGLKVALVILPLTWTYPLSRFVIHKPT